MLQTKAMGVTHKIWHTFALKNTFAGSILPILPILNFANAPNNTNKW
jgi:hypothetical protein